MGSDTSIQERCASQDKVGFLVIKEKKKEQNTLLLKINFHEFTMTLLIQI